MEKRRQRGPCAQRRLARSLAELSMRHLPPATDWVRLATQRASLALRCLNPQLNLHPSCILYLATQFSTPSSPETVKRKSLWCVYARLKVGGAGAFAPPSRSGYHLGAVQIAERGLSAAFARQSPLRPSPFLGDPTTSTFACSVIQHPTSERH